MIARDRFGKKPLHYAAGDRLFFGSEIKAILAVAPELAEVSNEVLLQYMYFGYVPDPLTAYSQSISFLPGNCWNSKRVCCGCGNIGTCLSTALTNRRVK